MHAAQLACWDSPARFTFFIAGTRSGKTSFGPWWLWREIQRRGQGDYLAVTSTFKLFNNAMLPYMLQVFERILGIGRYWPANQVLELKDPASGEFWASRAHDLMWARIILGSAQAKGGLEAATAKGAWLDEVGQDEFDLLAWEAVLRRLSLDQGRVLGTTTPYNLGWLKTQVFDQWRLGDPDFRIIQAASTINPGFPQAEFERAQRSMPDWRFQMFYHGSFSRPEGLIFGDFDENVHWIDPVALDPSWPRFVGIDFGAVNTAAIFVAHNPNRDVYYVYREYLEGGKSTEQHVADILDLTSSENVIVWVGGAKAEKQQRWDWAEAGIPVIEPYIADVEAGIDRVTSLFKRKTLYLFKSCPGLRDELMTYSRALDENGQVIEKIKDKERYHRLDALRYVAGELDVQTGLQVLGYTSPLDHS